MVRTTRRKKGFLGSKVDHGTKKCDFLKEIVKNTTSTRSLFKKCQNEINFYNKEEIRPFIIQVTY